MTVVSTWQLSPHYSYRNFFTLKKSSKYAQHAMGCVPISRKKRYECIQLICQRYTNYEGMAGWVSDFQEKAHYLTLKLPLMGNKKDDIFFYLLVYLILESFALFCPANLFSRQTIDESGGSFHLLPASFGIL